MATLNLGRVRGEKGADSTVPGPRGIPGPPGPQGPKGEDATNANLGTAATKDVGTGAEQIPQNKNLGSAAYRNIRSLHKDLFELYPQEKLGASYDLNSGNQFPLGDRSLIAQGVLNSPALIFGGDYYYVETKPYDASNRFQIAVGYSSSIIVTRRTNGGVSSWSPWILSGQSSDTVTKDVTGNIAVSSIQAGAGAPKIAHKKITGTTSSAISSSVTLQTGIAADKIIGMSCLVASSKGLIPPNTYPNGGDELYYCVVNPDGSIKVSLSSGSASYGVVSKPITILLTYEV